VAISIIGRGITQATSIIAGSTQEGLRKRKMLGFQAGIQKRGDNKI
jgi:hypothetical protein